MSAQEREDGAALHRLAEACRNADPLRGWFHVEWRWDMKWKWTVAIERHDGDNHPMRFTAGTVAEAADKAREAVEATRA